MLSDVKLNVPSALNVIFVEPTSKADSLFLTAGIIVSASTIISPLLASEIAHVTPSAKIIFPSLKAFNKS